MGKFGWNIVVTIYEHEMRLIKKILVAITLFMVTSCGFSPVNILAKCTNISPYSYGLAKAKAGVEQYQVLLKTHQAAIAAGVDVDYSGIKRIDIDIPDKFSPIPLTQNNDFKGCVITVKNTKKRVCLFTASRKGMNVSVPKGRIDTGDFNSVPELARGMVLLMIEDDNPWVKNRRGYNYGHQRKDILLVENGKAFNRVVMPYNNSYSNPKCTYLKANEKPIIVRNLSVNRSSVSSFITNVLSVDGYNDVRISGITVKTPDSDLNGDVAISVHNSTNVTLSDITINGTYSQKNKYGYGISLDNVWNFRAKRMFGKGNWGIFGNNNVNTATIEDSEINRFDIHCYGRDVSFQNVKFFDLYNQFSSVYGRVLFEKCEFRNFTPVLIETSYNAYTEFNVNINDCVFYTTSQKNYLVSTGSLSGEDNPRPELKTKKLPIVNVKGLKVISLETGEEKKQVDVFLKKGKFIEERNIQNVIRLL